MAKGDNAEAATGLAQVEAYLAGVPEPARSTLERLRVMIREGLPAEATEAMSYGMPCFRLRRPVVGYAAFKRHCSLFPMSGSALAGLSEDLGGYETAKGTIRFASDTPLPRALVVKLLEVRLRELGEAG